MESLRAEMRRLFAEKAMSDERAKDDLTTSREVISLLLRRLNALLVTQGQVTMDRWTCITGCQQHGRILWCKWDVLASMQAWVHGELRNFVLSCTEKLWTLATSDDFS